MLKLMQSSRGIRSPVTAIWAPQSELESDTVALSQYLFFSAVSQITSIFDQYRHRWPTPATTSWPTGDVRHRDGPLSSTRRSSSLYLSRSRRSVITLLFGVPQVVPCPASELLLLLLLEVSVFREEINFGADPDRTSCSCRTRCLI